MAFDPETIASEVLMLLGDASDGIQRAEIIAQMPTVVKEICEEAAVSSDVAFRKLFQREFKATVANDGVTEFDLINLGGVTYADGSITPDATQPTSRFTDSEIC